MVKGICRNGDIVVTASWLQTKVYTMAERRREYRGREENKK